MKKEIINTIMIAIMFVAITMAISGYFGEEIRMYSKWIFIPWIIQTIAGNWSSIKTFIKRTFK